MVRLFAALALPPEIGEALTRRQAGLAGARWLPLDRLHITLRFFGEIAETKADDLEAELSRVTGAPIVLALEGAGAFDEGGAVRAVWAGVADNPALRQLARRCEMAARRAGLGPDRRAYRPHVTLAYLDRPDPARVAAWIQANNLLRSPDFQLEAFGLYSSRLGAGGARYRLERLYRLGAP